MDTDGGIDDALALILALRSPEVEVVGVSTVSGNVRVEQAAINVLRVIELFDHLDIWVAQGLANPLIRDPVRATSFHGMDGLGDSNLPQPRMRARKERAVGLDVTSAPENWLTPPEYARIKATKNRPSIFAARILANTMQKRRMFELHDPIAVGAAIQPSLYDFKERSVKIETKGEYTTGMTVTERREEADNIWTENPIKICTNLKSQRFKRLFLSHLLKN